MNKLSFEPLKQFLEDRLLATLAIALAVLAIVYSIYVGVSLQPSDLQVAVHYTAFGDTNFYRDKWYYLATFIGFGLIFAIAHPILAVKLFMQDRRDIALIFLIISLFLLVVAWFLTSAILGVAFL